LFLACYVLQMVSLVKLPACLLLATLLFGCAHTADGPQSGSLPAGADLRLPSDPAPGHPVVLLLADECPVRAALFDALASGGAAVEITTSQGEQAALAQLAVLAARVGGGPPHRFIVGLGQTFSLTALKAAAHAPLSGIVLVAPRLEESRPPAVPTLLLQGDSARPLHSAAGEAIWKLRLPSLDHGWRELPPDQLHALTEAIVLWVRTRSEGTTD
jgi:hypothetical protein